MAHAQKILRIGIIKEGKIIEESLVKKREPVTIGNSDKATFKLDDAKGLPPVFTLFNIKGGGQYQLVFTDDMDGRISVKDANVNFNSLKSQGLAQKSGDNYSVNLADQSRGKISLGPYTILFQFVTPPPEPVKPQMPTSAQNYWLKAIDKVYVGVMLGSILLHVGAIGILETRPIPKGIKLEDIPDRFRAILAPQKPVEQAPEVAEEGTKEAETSTAEESGDDQEEGGDDQGGGGSLSPVDRDKIRQQVASKGILAVLTAKGGVGGGALADVLGEGTVGGNLDSIMSGIGGVGLASSADVKTAVGGGSGKAATLDSLGAKGIAGSGRSDKLGKGKAAKVSGAISVSTPEIEGNLDRKAVARVVRRGLRSIKDCYERALKRNPGLKGKVIVGFTIAPSGRVVSAKVVSSSLSDSSVGQCILSRLRRWRFPKSEGADTYIEYPFVFTPAS